MNKCPICGKEVENWEHPKHLNSKQHQDAGKKADEITGLHYTEAIFDKIGPQCDEELVELDEEDDLLFTLMTENFELLCKKKIIIGIMRVNAFSMLVNYTMQDVMSEEQLKVLYRLRKTYF